MILVDTSAWIEFLRDTGSPTARSVDDALGSDIGVGEPVVMEVLAGARDDLHLRDLRRLLARAHLVRTEAVDYDAAAELYRTCRARGETVRKLLDCLIAAIAIRAGAQLLHNHTEFDALARHTPLRVERAG